MAKQREKGGQEAFLRAVVKGTAAVTNIDPLTTKLTM